MPYEIWDSDTILHDLGMFGLTGSSDVVKKRSCIKYMPNMLGGSIQVYRKM